MIRPEEDNIWQVLQIGGSGKTILHSWHPSKALAECELERATEIFEFTNVWIERGTDYISRRCQGCGSIFCAHRYDLNGNRRGFWCMDCYKNDDVFIYPRTEDQGKQFESLREFEE